MSELEHYVPRDYPRICDECGKLRRRSNLHRKYRWLLCSDCDQPGDRIQEQLDAAIARQRPFRILPVPNAKPQDYDNPYNWQLEEAQVFNFVASTAPARTIGGASDPATAAFVAGYLADIISDGTRPPAWLATARAKVASLLTYLLTQQTGSANGPAATVDNPRYGGFLVGGSYNTTAVIGAGLAFVKAYVLLGDPTYLAGANRCATFLRHAQCGDVQATKHTVFPVSGQPYHVGGLPVSVNDATGLQSAFFIPDDGLALVFFRALSAVVGASATYGDAASTSSFTAATSASLATMILELVAFLEAGPFDSANNGLATSALSPTSPKATYGAYLSDGSGAGSWGSPVTVSGVSIAKALAGLFAINGADATVTASLAWLAAIAPNAANATPATNSPQQTLDGITGTYSPATAPALAFTTSAPFTEAATATYDLAALGFLAPVLNSTNVAALKNSRAIVSPVESYSVSAADGRYLGPLGRAGLSLQPRTSATTVIPDALLAAQFGAIYRFAMPAAYSIPGKTS